MNIRSEISYMIDDYTDDQYNGDRSKAMNIWIRLYRKIGKKYNINVNREATLNNWSKIEYLERKGLISEAFDIVKQIIVNDKIYMERKNRKG